MIQRNKIVSVTPTVDTAAYATGDLLAGLMTFNVANAGGGGVIKSAAIVDLHSQNAAVELWLFTSTLAASTLTLNSAATLADADLATIIPGGVIAFATTHYFSLANNSVASREDVAIPFTADSGNIYGILVSRGAPDYLAATDVTVILGVMLNG